MKTVLIAFCVIFILGTLGCDEKPNRHRDIPVQDKEIVEAQKNDLWTVTIEGEFDDDKAYNGMHRIYRLRHKDGTEIIGITGVGVTSVGIHSSGKSTTKDEL